MEYYKEKQFMHYWSPRGEERKEKVEQLFFKKRLRTSQVLGDIQISKLHEVCKSLQRFNLKVSKTHYNKMI